MAAIYVVSPQKVAESQLVCWAVAVVVFFVLGATSSWGASDQSIQPITLHYIQRPPYIIATEDGPTGLTGLPTFRAFKKAQIAVATKETPFARQLRYVEANSGKDCMIGMFKKPERELFAKFTKPVYKDQAQVILTAASNVPRFAAVKSIDDLFNDKEMVFLAKLGYSYGVALDTLIQKLGPKTRKTSDENLLMIKAIKLKTADYMVIAPEEASEAIAAAGFSDRDFMQLKLKNMPAGDYRHIMCSKNVPDEIIERLNAAIGFGK